MEDHATITEDGSETTTAIEDEESNASRDKGYPGGQQRIIRGYVGLNNQWGGTAGLGVILVLDALQR